MEVSSTNHRAWLSGEAEHSAEPRGKTPLPKGMRATLMTFFFFTSTVIGQSREGVMVLNRMGSRHRADV